MGFSFMGLMLWWRQSCIAHHFCRFRWDGWIFPTPLKNHSLAVIVRIDASIVLEIKNFQDWNIYIKCLLSFTLDGFMSLKLYLVITLHMFSHINILPSINIKYNFLSSGSFLPLADYYSHCIWEHKKWLRSIHLGSSRCKLRYHTHPKDVQFFIDRLHLNP